MPSQGAEGRANFVRARTESLRVFRSCPLITPKDARSSLQMLAMARAMAALCALIGRLLARRSGTPEKLSGSERFILREERSWLQDVIGTRNLARQVAS
jgi:hypothetical protein